MSAPSLTPSLSPDLSHAPLPLRVLLDTSLLRHVTSFQAGMPLDLRPFWEHVDATEWATLTNVRSRIDKLTSTVVATGSWDHVELLQRVWLRDPQDAARAVWHVQPYITQIGTAAAALNRVDLLQRALDHDEAPEINSYYAGALWSAAMKGYQPNDVRVLDVLTIRSPIDPTRLTTATAKIMQHDRIDAQVLHYLHEHVPAMRLPEYVLDIAARRGDQAVVRVLVEHRMMEPFGARPFDTAYHRGDFEMLACLFEHALPALRRDHQGDRFQRLIVHDPKPEAQALMDQYGHLLPQAFQLLIDQALDANDVEKFRAWYDAGRLDRVAPISIERAVYRKSLDVIRFLHDKDIAAVTAGMMDLAVQLGDWALVDFLHTHRTEGCTTRAMDEAVRHSSLDQVQWLYENLHVGCSQDTLLIAVIQGRIDILRYLHEHTTATCTTDAMDAAAQWGCLEALQFLHEHRTEGCTTAAIDKAAANGHIEVVRFLIQNRSEGCTTAAVQVALECRYLDIVSLLHAKWPHLFGPEHLHGLLLRGFFELYMALQEKYPEQADAVVDKVMYEAGRDVEYPTIRFIFDILGRRDVAHRAMDGAAEGSEGGRARSCWVAAVYAITGPGSCRLSAVRNAVKSYDPYTFHVDSAAHIPFLVDVCCEPGAREAAIATAKKSDRSLAEAMADWDQFVASQQTDRKPMTHPFFSDQRTPAWAIQLIVDKQFKDDALAWDDDCDVPATWAIRAAHRGDTTLLDVLRDLPLGTVEPRYYLDCYEIMGEYEPFGFKGVRAAAERANSTAVLQWLRENNVE